MSEGEEFIKLFLEKSNITYRTEEPITGLQNDSKNIRYADFYLPKYQVYIEYFGQFNVENQKARYQEKRKVYIENQIPCVLIYPENLGILGYVFKKRMLFVLKKYKLENSLRKYRMKLFWDYLNETHHGLVLFFGALVVFGSSPFNTQQQIIGLLIGIFMLLYSSIGIIKIWNKIIRE
jgi:hypothetical protein